MLILTDALRVLQNLLGMTILALSALKSEPREAGVGFVMVDPIAIPLEKEKRPQ